MYFYFLKVNIFFKHFSALSFKIFSLKPGITFQLISLCKVTVPKNTSRVFMNPLRIHQGLTKMCPSSFVRFLLLHLN